MDLIPYIFPENLEELTTVLGKNDYAPKKILLNHKKINRLRAKKLGLALYDAKKLIHFSIVHTPLSVKSLHYILGGFDFSKTLVHLGFEGCKIGNDGAKLVAQLMEYNRSIQVLDLRDNKLTNEGVEHFFKMFETNCHCHHFLLSKNKFTWDLIRPLANAMEASDTIVSFDIGETTQWWVRRRTFEITDNRRKAYLECLDRVDEDKSKFNMKRICVLGDRASGKTEVLHNLVHNCSSENFNKDPNAAAAAEDVWPVFNFVDVKTHGTKLEFWTLKEDLAELNHLEEHGLRHLWYQHRRGETVGQQPKFHQVLEVQKNRKPRSTILPRRSNKPRKPSRSAAAKLRRTTVSNASASPLHQNDSMRNSDEEDFIDEEIAFEKKNSQKTNKSLTPRKTFIQRTLGRSLKRTKSMESNGTVSSMSSVTAKVKKSFIDTKNSLKKKSSTFAVFGPRKRFSSHISVEDPEGEDVLTDFSDSDEDFKVGENFDLNGYVKDNIAGFHEVDTSEMTAPGTGAVERMCNKLKKDYDDERTEEFMKKGQSYQADAHVYDLLEKRANKKRDLWIEPLTALKNKINENNPDDAIKSAKPIHRASLMDVSREERAKTADDPPVTGANPKYIRRGLRRQKDPKTVGREMREMKNPLFHRHYCDQAYMNLKPNLNGMHLYFWEFTANTRKDALYTKLHKDIMPQDNALTMIVFDAYQVFKKKQHARKTLKYYLNLANIEDSKIILVAANILKLPDVEALLALNKEVTEILRETGNKEVLLDPVEHFVFFGVDALESYNFVMLRNYLENAIKHEEPFKRSVSMKEMALLDAITHERYDSKGKLKIAVDVKEVEFWAEKMNISRASLPETLDLFHHMGFIFYYKRSHALRSKIITKPKWLLNNLKNVCNPDLLRTAYDLAHRADEFDPVTNPRPELRRRKAAGEKVDYNSDDSMEESELKTEIAKRREKVAPNPAKQCMATEKMLSYILSDISSEDLAVAIDFMIETCVLAEWPWTESLGMLDRVAASDKSRKFLIPSLINEKKKEIYELRKHLKELEKYQDSPKSYQENAVKLLGEVGRELTYQVKMQVGKEFALPSSFCATLFCELSQFFLQMERRVNTRRNQKLNFDLNLRSCGSSGAVLVDVTVENVNFKILPELFGALLFVNDKHRQDGYIAHLLFTAMINKVNKETLGLNLKFLQRIGSFGKLEGFSTFAKRQKKKNKIKFEEVFDNAFNTKSIRVGSKSPAGVEEYFMTL